MADPFIPRTYQELTDGQLDWIASDPLIPAGLVPSDLVPGSLELAQAEAPAVLIEELEARVAASILRAIPEAVLEAFDLGIKPATRSLGTVVFSALVLPASDIAIPAGFQLLSVDGVAFRTTAAGILPAAVGISQPIQIEATEPGPAGNVPAEDITRMPTPIYGVDLVVNPSATVGGREEETPDERRDRVAAFLKTLQRGTLAALEFAALSTGLVTAARAFEPCELDPRPAGIPFAGLAWLFLDDGGDGVTLNASVATTIRRVLVGYTTQEGLPVDGWKAAGIRLDLYPCARRAFRVRGTVRLAPGAGARWAAVRTSLDAALAAALSSLRPGAALDYATLAAQLRSADADILAVDLWLWFDGAPEPAADALPSGDGLDPVTFDPLTNGSRLVLAAAASWAIA